MKEMGESMQQMNKNTQNAPYYLWITFFRLSLHSVDIYGGRSFSGTYTYNHPELKIKVQSLPGCEECIDGITATVSDDKKSFEFKITGGYIHYINFLNK